MSRWTWAQGPWLGVLLLQEAGEGPQMSSQGSFGDLGLEVLEGPHHEQEEITQTSEG